MNSLTIHILMVYHPQKETKNFKTNQSLHVFHQSFLKIKRQLHAWFILM